MSFYRELRGLASVNIELQQLCKIPILVLLIIQPRFLIFPANIALSFWKDDVHYLTSPPFSASGILDTIIGSVAAPLRQCSALRGPSTPSFLASAGWKTHEHLSVSFVDFNL
jgi:hypothetical protein